MNVHPSLMRHEFVMHEHVGFANRYDFVDPASGQILFRCTEPKLGFFPTLSRIIGLGFLGPVDLHLTDVGGQFVLRIRRGYNVIVWGDKFKVLDGQQRLLCEFEQPMIATREFLRLRNVQGEVVMRITGKLLGNVYHLMVGEREIARITKKWSGALREVFTDADRYHLAIDSSLDWASPTRIIALATVVAVDQMLHEA